MRESYDNKLRALAKRIAEIKARERRVPADQEKGTRSRGIGSSESWVP